MNFNLIFGECPYCRKKDNIVVCGDLCRCLNHDINVWFSFTKRIMGCDGYCIEICFLEVATKVFKCPKIKSFSDIETFDYLSSEKKYVWGCNLVYNIKPENFKKFLHKIRTIIVFS